MPEPPVTEDAMGMPIQVEGARLRSGAGKMRELAGKAADIPSDPLREGKDADRANGGFMTGEACKAVAEDLKEDMKELKEHWESTEGLLKDIADDWEEADKENASIFEQLANELAQHKSPGM